MDIYPRILPQTSQRQQATPFSPSGDVGDRAPTPPALHLHIERVVFDGIDLPQAQRPKLHAALEAELTRLLSEHGVETSWRRGGAIPHLSGSPLTLCAPIDPVRLGKQLAHAIYGGLRP